MTGRPGGAATLRPIGWSADGRSHHVPGRYLVRIPEAGPDGVLRARVERLVLGLPGARSARTNPRTGRLLVYYDPDATGPDDIDRLLAQILSGEPAPPAGAAGRPLPAWHARPADAVVADLRTHPRLGLTRAEAAWRLRRTGPNAIRPEDPPGAWQRFLRQLNEPMVALLLGVAGLSAALGQVLDAVVVVGIVVVNGVIGALQEGRAAEALAHLERLSAPVARVVREGRLEVVPAEMLVPGDVVAVRAGDRVPADLRLLRATGLAAEEAALTGEPAPVPKGTRPVPVCTPLAERSPLLFMGTHVTAGRGRGVVVATGMATEMGRIAALLAGAAPAPLLLQQRMQRLVAPIVRATVAAAAVLFGLGLLRGTPAGAMLLASLSTAVAALPEGLPVSVSVATAAAAYRMGGRLAVARQPAAVETLGSCQVICTDKTGTLTTGRMSVEAVYAAGTFWLRSGPSGPGGVPAGFARAGPEPVQAGADDLRFALRVGILCSDTRLAAMPPADGDPTEVALLQAAQAVGLDITRERIGCPRLREWPFSSDSRQMAVLCREPDGGPALYVKGAPEDVLPRLSRERVGGEEVPLGPAGRAAAARAVRQMARAGLRVLALAYRPAHLPEDELVLAGIAGLWDPPRPEVPEALRRCREAGIRVVMLTGDHPETARTLGRRLGILDGGGVLLTGTEIDRMDDGTLAAVAGRLQVCARVTPHHKLRVVRALQRLGLAVAMTGDGVNDAPAVRAADTGIAMGRSGTDITRAAADLTLLDDNFASIVAAVEEGRAAFQNIRRTVRYTLVTNAAEVAAMVGAVALGLPPPLLPVQLLWVNLVCDGLPALALAVDRPGPDLMTRPPVPPGESLLEPGAARSLLLQGLLAGAGMLGTFALLLRHGAGLAAARTGALAALVLTKLAYLSGCRRDPRTGAAPPPNRLLRASTAASGALLLATLYVPGVGRIFGTVPLAPARWAPIGGLVAAQHLVGRLFEAGPPAPPRPSPQQEG
ncbi:cation-translocating P-type ATPase [Caldinitratiruptor microaerophilus]|uniref:Calcium-transporting P-type ATPase, PMR1-type n=1 Tax=Caldinitratiruptor microaerophilus TaxID=671077 RepID=A0AA35G9R7_9FIRM|nr:cation-transporting P-type ATPase [Caldinitratiruptor microaerophilus]BDG62361.1 calcium-transporting P-type ATPase, PMR1-type [Caldinitratiruptor microaerophilus]